MSTAPQAASRSASPSVDLVAWPLAKRMRLVSCPRCAGLARRQDRIALELAGAAVASVETDWALSCRSCRLAIGDAELLAELEIGDAPLATRYERFPNRWLPVSSPSDAVSVEARQLLERARQLTFGRPVGASVIPLDSLFSTPGQTAMPDGGLGVPISAWSEPMTPNFQTASILPFPTTTRVVDAGPTADDEHRRTFWREFMDWLGGASDEELEQLEQVLQCAHSDSITAFVASMRSALQQEATRRRLPASLVTRMQEANWPLAAACA